MSIVRRDTHNSCLNASTSLNIDEACFSILNEYYRNVTFFARLSDCHLCDGIPQANLTANSNTTFIVTTKFPLHVYYSSDYEYCHETFTFKEYGSYGWNLSKADLCSHIYTNHEPVDSYLPLIVAFMTSILLLIVWTTSKVVIRVVKGRLTEDTVHDDFDRLQETESITHPVIRTTRSSTRIQSVDTFRGIAILLMIFVNNGGGKYVFFNHSPWFGLTVADLVLPWFAWIMGLTITISKRAELRVTASRGKLILRCLQRSLLLILLGLTLNSMHSKSLSNLRFPGVLQMLAVTYFVCAAMETIFMKSHTQFGHFSILRDILDSWPQWLIITGIVTTHTLLTFLLEVPNCPKGYLGPGGYEHFGDHRNCTAGVAGYIDRLIFGSHMYSNTHNFVYGPIARYDPEGLMNTVSAIFVVYLGVHAGKILLSYYQCNSRVIRWLIWAVVLGIIAGILCTFQKDEGIIPVSKRMWTLSYVLTVSSFAFILYSVLYVLIDYKQYWNGAPFIYAGINPIFLYVGHMLTMNLFPWAWELSHPTHTSILAMNLWTTILWGFIAYYLYRKDIIITV